MSNLEIKISPVKKGEAYKYARIACEEDVIECMASYGLTPLQAAKYSIRVSERVYSIYVNGELICITGVTRHSALSDAGSIWMLCTVNIHKYPLVFMKAARPIIMDMMLGFSKVDNHVDARNIRMVRALQFLGFKMDTAKPFGILQRPFHYFWREAACA